MIVAVDSIINVTVTAISSEHFMFIMLFYLSYCALLSIIYHQLHWFPSFLTREGKSLFHVAVIASIRNFVLQACDVI